MENKKPILIVGAGGLGREIFQFLNEINSVKPEWDILGFLDDNKHTLDGFENYPSIIGTISDYNKIKNNYIDPVFLIIAIGNPCIKKRTVVLLNCEGVKWATLIHPTASIGMNSIIEEGSVLSRNSVVSCDAKIGRHVHINMLSSCDHDVIIDDFCTISLKVDIQGGAQLGEGVFLGGGADVLAKVKIGDWAKVGASALVLKDVKPGTTVSGVPAKEHSKIDGISKVNDSLESNCISY